MPGTALAIGALAGAVALTGALCAAGAAAVTSQRAAAAADAAALAAADTASGVIGGVPCERAAEIAAAHGAGVSSCTVDGLIATVSVSIPFGVLSAPAIARAGPPP